MQISIQIEPCESCTGSRMVTTSGAFVLSGGKVRAAKAKQGPLQRAGGRRLDIEALETHQFVEATDAPNLSSQLFLDDFWPTVFRLRSFRGFSLHHGGIAGGFGYASPLSNTLLSTVIVVITHLMVLPRSYFIPVTPIAHPVVGYLLSLLFRFHLQHLSSPDLGINPSLLRFPSMALPGEPTSFTCQGSCKAQSGQGGTWGWCRIGTRGCLLVGQSVDGGK